MIGEAVGLAAPSALRQRDTRKADVAAVQEKLVREGTSVHRSER